MEHIDDFIDNLDIQEDLKEKFKICNLIWHHKNKRGKVKFRLIGSPTFRKLKVMERHSLLFPTYQPKLILLGPLAFFKNGVFSWGIISFIFIFLIYFNRPYYTLFIIPILWLFVGAFAALSVTKKRFIQEILKSNNISEMIKANEIDITPRQSFINEMLTKYENKKILSLLILEFLFFFSVFLVWFCPNMLLNMQGSIGCKLEKSADNYINVASLREQAPAKLSGLKVGDKIVEINGKSTFNQSANKVVSEIRGLPETEVGIKVQRGQNSFSYKIKRKRL